MEPQKITIGIKGKALHSQTRELIANVIAFMKEEGERSEAIIPLKKLKNRVLAATKISESSYKRIAKESRNIQSGTSTSFSTPPKQRSRPCPKSDLPTGELETIGSIIHNFYVIEKRTPTLKGIYNKVMESGLSFNGGIITLRSIMRKLGFSWTKAADKRHIIKESHDIRMKRINYLKQLTQYKQEGRPIIYTDETYIHTTHSQGKEWSDGSAAGLKRPMSKGKRLIIVHAGGATGFVPNALLIFPSELDLDFLERRQNAGPTPEVAASAKSPVEVSPESVDRVKVILLGAPAVGKTSIIQQQFVWNDFCEDYVPTDRKHTYYPSVITNERLYEIKISDLPVIPYFPVNSYYEWTDYRYYGLRSATAYILVFDLSNIETFQYIKTLREQICESRNMTNVPMLVVGNKEDLVATPEESTSGGKSALTSGLDDKRRDIINLVKKHWKCGYIECSAKYNWKVVSVFKELMNMIDSIEIRDQSPMLDNIQDALDRNKCSVL